MLNNFFNDLLQKSESRIAPTKGSTRFLMDKNEQAEDVDIALKMKVLDSLLNANWNRYPTSDYQDIETKIAEYCGLKQENIVLSSGSASIITTLLDFFSLNKKNITITQPSYSLFDYHCKTYNIPYKPWYLTTDLNYDYDNLPDLDKDSVLIITSPNNPVGNTIDLNYLEFILTLFPESIIILDGVYTEFSSIDYTSLLKKYENLIILRSFSKAFPLAGLRLGYLCASPKIASVIKKLVLQFSITPFSLIFAREMLFDAGFMASSKKKVQDIIIEREKLYLSIKRSFDEDILKAYKSEGNFLLIRVFDDATFEHSLSTFANNGIKILNTSSFSLLDNTFRVSIGNDIENKTFLQCLSKGIEDEVQKFPLELVVKRNLSLV